MIGIFDMNPEIYARILRFVDIARERFERNIPPTEGDRVWFENNTKSRGGWPRRFRVRETIPSDHWVFAIGEHSPKDYITIISRSPPTIALVRAGEDTFGPVINTDEYALMRWVHLNKEYELRDNKSEPA